MRQRPERTEWVAYVRVSTAEQAERELSLPAQQKAIREFAVRHGATIAQEYIEAGASGTDRRRPVLQRLLGDALKPTSTISTIVVHHTSRFTRDATHARVMKAKLRKAGVRVMSVLQEFTDDPVGKLMEGFFECIDQYESELNGLRTSAAMREAVRQGHWPGARAPYGYRSVPVEVHPGVVHHRLVLEPAEAELVREAFELYVGQSGAKSVARTLNQRGYRTRAGALWSKNLVMLLLEEEALTGTVWWGRRKGRALRPKEEWMSLKVEPIIDTETWALAQQLRGEREPKRTPGRAPTRPKLLKGLAWCGKCGASYQYETGGKTVINGHYTYGSTTVETSCASGRKRAADSGSRPRRWMRPSWGRSRGSSAPRNAGEIWRAAVVGPSTGFSTPGARLFAARR
ncbi:recombinase family protein [Stigmatella aurantiaca]|uniref:Recombinase n=1 Tax=Stigmatella aurantiaca (strain DW4/3-1) TaxID=378806 RepID=E3FF33_STIAD|nr:recombinase family protein [Stigmatella aurantiaca]ADO70214.1 recombinase [Stigmatella aurantiaca DW4/3-1]